MKKLAVFLLFIFLFSLPVYAGNTPEEALYDDMYKLFFGTVEGYKEGKKESVIKFTPTKMIRGELSEKSYEIQSKHDMTTGEFKPEKGSIYLFMLYDSDNDKSVRVFDVTEYNTSSLQIKHIEQDSNGMWNRFQDYLNQGKYGYARLDAPPATKPSPISNMLIAMTVAITVLLAVSIVFILKKKKRQIS